MHSQGALSNNGPIFFGYWIVAAAFVTQFVSVGVTNYVAGPFMVPMSDELGFSRSEFTIPRTLGGFVSALVGYFIGTWIDRFGGRLFVCVGSGFAALALWLHSDIRNLSEWVFLNGMFLTGAVALLGPLVVNATLSKWFVIRRGRAIAYAAMGVSFAGIGFTPAITWLIDMVGWRTSWQVLAIIPLLLAFPMGFFMRRAPEDYGLYPDGKLGNTESGENADGQSSKITVSLTRSEAVRTATFYMLVIAFGLVTVNIGVLLLHAVPFLTDAGYGRGQAALMIAVTSVPALVTKPIWGYLIDRFTPKNLAAAGSIITGIGLVCIILSVQYSNITFTAAGFFLLGIGWGGMIPVQEVIWATYFGRDYIASVRSAALPFALVISAGAPLAVSYYFDAMGSYNGAFWLVSFASFLAAIILMLMRTPERLSPTDSRRVF